MDFQLTKDEEILLDTIKDFVDNRVDPHMVEIERANRIPDHIFAEASQLGLFGMSIPVEYGGTGLSRFERALVHQMFGRTGFGFAGALASHTGIGSDALVAIGSEEQKRRYLPRMATGELRACFALTESEAGSDAGGIKTVAEKKGDRYILNGTKRFISGGATSGVITVIARSNTKSRDKEFSVFLVEPTFSGFKVGATYDPMGARGHSVAELVFIDCEVPEENRLGAEGEGWLAVMRTLSSARPLVAARCVGACERLIELSTSYARVRKQFGQPIGEFQAMQFMLADMVARTEAARWLTYKAASGASNGRERANDISIAKLFSTEALAFVADTALQIQGGVGYMNDSPVSRFYRDARVTRIYEGTSEIQRLIIGRNTLRE